MTVTLWHIELSHYNEKARWALDYKGVDYTLRAPVPGLHGPVAMALTRSRHRRLPILRLDGRTIPHSAAIVAALEERYPEPPLYPDDPAERERALELERHFDEVLAPALRLFVWYHQLREPNGFLDAIAPHARPRRRRIMRAMTPVAKPFVRTDYGAGAKRAEEARGTLRAVMDHIEMELQPSGYLVGDRFSVADLAGAALYTPLICPPGRAFPPKTSSGPLLELRAELEARDGGRWIHEMFARHRGTSRAVAA